MTTRMAPWMASFCTAVKKCSMGTPTSTPRATYTAIQITVAGTIPRRNVVRRTRRAPATSVV